MSEQDNKQKDRQQSETQIAAISKSQLKREQDDLDQLGLNLTKLPVTILGGFDIDEQLKEAVLFARTIKSHGAKRRQIQYIGKLLRNTDAESIEKQYRNHINKQHQVADHFHKIEKCRDDLLVGGDLAINDLLNSQPQLERGQLRQLIRNSKKEQEKNKPPKSARQLFQYLKENIK